jgi:hypothetical protein
MIMTNNNKLLAPTVIYLVMICSGAYEDYTERHIFATADKEKAEKWQDKYNLIIANNKDRISKYYTDQDWHELSNGSFRKPFPFWYTEIRYYKPIAKVVEIEWR